MAISWDAKVYSQFISARTRPAYDLLSAVSQSLAPALICDLGCGPGNSTILLKAQWPEAKVIGIDSSQEMLNEARAQYPQLDFLQADIAHFSLTEKIDLIFANASLQWVAQHELIIPKLVANLTQGGILAIQMPNNFHQPSHQLVIQILQERSAWKPLLNKLRYSVLHYPMYKIDEYYKLLNQSGLTQLMLWETEYYQEMPDHQAIYEWTSGTGLRPILSNMAISEQPLFIKEYIHRLSMAYPLQPTNKVLFSFRRIFMLGTKNKG
jgi:trans-aconitate 2-methyltransferase